MTPKGEIRPKWLTKAQLVKVLQDLPDDACLMPNAVGNLAVVLGENIDAYAQDQEKHRIDGYIDFQFEGVYEECEW